MAPPHRLPRPVCGGAPVGTGPRPAAARPHGEGQCVDGAAVSRWSSLGSGTGIRPRDHLLQESQLSRMPPACGGDEDEVDAFVDVVAAELARLVAGNNKL